MNVIEAVGGLPEIEALAETLRNGGDPNEKKDGRTALDWAVTLGSAEKVRLLLEQGADPNLANDPDPEDDGRYITPLICAVRDDSRKELAELLLGAGADPNLTDDLGMTPLMCAASLGATELVKLLVKAGANPQLKSSAGQDVLYFATNRDNPEIVNYLLDIGLDPHSRPPNGGPSVVERARKRNLVRTLEVLKEKGFD